MSILDTTTVIVVSSSDSENGTSNFFTQKPIEYGNGEFKFDMYPSVITMPLSMLVRTYRAVNVSGIWFDQYNFDNTDWSCTSDTSETEICDTYLHNVNGTKYRIERTFDKVLRSTTYASHYIWE